MEEILVENSEVGSPMGSTEVPESLAQRIFDTALTVDKYYTPLLFLFGTLGNALSVAVFCMNAKYQNQSASYYLSALAISDTGFLINLLAVWLENVYGGWITSDLLCPLVMYLGQITCFMSVYLTVAFSIERFVAVHYPLSRPRICTRSKAKKVIAALTAVALLVFSYAWVIAKVVELPYQRYDYDDTYPGMIPESSWNLTQEESLKLHPVTEKMKKESFPVYNIPRQELPTSYKKASSKPLNNIVEKVKGCSKGNHTIYNDSLSFQAHREHQPNCRRLHSDGTISKIFGSADRETSTNAENTVSQNMMNQYRSGEEDDGSFLSGGYICSVPEDYYKISEIANYLDSIVTLIIPFFLITYFNVRIALCVWKLKDQRQNIVANTATNNHLSRGLRCSAKYSKCHLNERKKNSENENVGAEHILQQTHQKDNGNGIIGSAEDEKGLERKFYRGSQKGTFRFPGSSYKLNGAGPSNDDATPSSSESEESRLAGNSRGDDDEDYRSNPLSGCGNGRDHEITLTANKMSTGDGLRNKITNFIRRPSPSSEQVIKGVKIKLEQGSSEQGSFSQRVAVRPELSVVKQRSSSEPTSSNAAEVRVTKTLLLVSTVFLVLNLPAHAIRCALSIQRLRGTSDGNELLHAAQPWTNILFNTNFAVNFLLYCVSGRNFRKSLRNIILRKFNKSKANAWRPVKTCLKSEIDLKRTSGVVLNRNGSNKQLGQVTETIELDDRRTESVYPIHSQIEVDVNCTDEVKESMTLYDEPQLTVNHHIHLEN